MWQPLLSAAPSPPLAQRGGAAPLPAPSQQHTSSSRFGRGLSPAARPAGGSGGRKALRSAAVAWSGPQQEERPLAQEEQLGDVPLEGGWSEELQAEFEEYQAQTPVGEPRVQEGDQQCSFAVTLRSCAYAQTRQLLHSARWPC